MKDCGYTTNNGGICGYIGAAMLMSYIYWEYGDWGLLKPEHYPLEENDEFYVQKDLTLALRAKGSNNGTTAYDLKAIIPIYLKETSPRYDWNISADLLGGTGPCKFIDNNYPVELFGNFDMLNGKNGNHAVIAYGYKKYGFLSLGYKYRVHYGWNGNNDIWLDGVIGSKLYWSVK